MIVVGCSGPLVTNGNREALESVKPLTIQVAAGSAQDATSFVAEVKTVRSDSRISTGFELIGNYRLAVRLSDGRVMSRIDYPESAFNDGMARTILNDGTSVMELAADGTVSERMAIPDDVAALYQSVSSDPSLRMNTLFRKVSGRQLVESLKRMNFRVEQGSKISETTLVAPPETLQSLLGGVRPIRFSITIDEEIGAVTTTQSVYAVDDEEVVTQTVNPVYLVQDDVPIPVGTLVETKHTFSTPLDTSAMVLPPADPESVAEISAEELQALEEAGSMVRSVPEPSLNPGNRDYVISSGEVYETMEVNAAPEELFRVLTKGANK